MKVYQEQIIQRFMSAEEYAAFTAKYDSHKKALSTKKSYDAKDWEMFNANAPLEDFMTKWGVGKDRAVTKLGQMVLLRNK